MKTFVVVNHGYPLEVHRANCSDIARENKDWKISGDSVKVAVEAEAKNLNSQFDDKYDVDELFRVMPCCRGAKR